MENSPDIVFDPRTTRYPLGGDERAVLMRSFDVGGAIVSAGSKRLSAIETRTTNFIIVEATSA